MAPPDEERNEPSGGRPRSWALDELSWIEVREILKRSSRLLFPVGSMDAYGPHLPLGANCVIVEALATALSERLGVLRAPVFRYGVCLEGWGQYPGTTSLRRKTLHRAVNELLAGWEDHGFEEIVILSAHRYDPHLDALLMALTSQASTVVIDLYSIEVTDLLEAAPEWEHAGELETSLLLHLAPDRVRTDHIEDVVRDRDEVRSYLRGRIPTPPKGSGGVLGRPSVASAEKGHRVFERYIDCIARSLDPAGAEDRPPEAGV